MSAILGALMFQQVIQPLLQVLLKSSRQVVHQFAIDVEEIVGYGNDVQIMLHIPCYIDVDDTKGNGMMLSKSCVPAI